MSDLGKRIQELRKQIGLTQAQLAAKIEISHTQNQVWKQKHPASCRCPAKAGQSI